MTQMDHSWVSRYPGLQVSILQRLGRQREMQHHSQKLLWNPPKHLTKKGIKKICYIHIMACFSAIKNDVTLFVEIWI